MKLQILQVRTTDSQSNIVPFHRFNLVRYEDRAYIPRLVRVALVMPFETHLWALYTNIPLTPYHTPHDGKRLPAPDLPAIKTLKPDDWILVLPLFTFKKRADEGLHIRYLISSRFQRRHTGRGKQRKAAPALEWPALTYLQTPQGPIRPVCRRCPAFLDHLDGKCNLGDDVCVQKLRVAAL